MNPAIISKLTSKGQTTVPQSVREALRLKPGDGIVYRFEGERVFLARAATDDEDPFATFTEWSGDADRRAYADL